MKKNIFTLSFLLALETLGAQIRTVNSATNGSVTNSPAFIDASSNTTVNGSSNVGKGLIFPRVDLSAMTAFPAVTAGIPNSFPTRFDGMIVYNTAASGTAGVGSTQGTLSPGYWYYENKSATNTGGTWKPVSTATAAVANTASNGLTLSGNDVKLGGTLSQATDIATAGNNLTISGTGNVGIGTAAPTENLDVSGTARLRTIPSSGGTVMLTADNNGVIRKQALPVASAPALKANISSSGISLSTTGPAGYSNTGFGITLPANSKYMVQIYQILRTANASYQVPAGQSVWVQATLADGPTATSSSADIMGGQYFSGTYSASMSLNMMSGILTINNTGSSAKTYYLAVRLGLVSGGLNTTLTELGNSGTSENQMIAIPIN